MGRKLLNAAFIAGCALLLAGCGVSVEQESDGEIWAGTADIRVTHGSFDAVAVGEQSTVEIIVENRGEGPLRLREPEVAEVPDDSVSEFELGGPPAEEPDLLLDPGIEPGGAARFLLSYEPRNRTPDLARISFESNDPEDPTYTVEFEPNLSE